MRKKILIGAPILILIGIIAYYYQPAFEVEQMKDKYTDEYSQFIELNGRQTHFKEKGNGMPVILIHGTSSSLHTWEQWEDELSQNYKTYSIDMPGGGLTHQATPYTADDFIMQTYISHIDAFVEQMGIDSFFLAGNSLGGHTAWEYAANSKYSDRVKKLVLVDPSGFFMEDFKRPFVFEMAKYKWLRTANKYINSTPFVKISLRDVFYNDDLVTRDLVQRYADLQHTNGNRSAFFLKVQGIQAGNVEDLKNIACPTLIQWGENDVWIPIELAPIFDDNIPNSELIVYPECGHVPMEEKAKETVADIMDFFAE